MITNTILIIFAILYYIFSIYTFAITIDIDKTGYGLFLIIIIFSPIAMPIVLIIKFGEWIKQQT